MLTCGREMSSLTPSSRNWSMMARTLTRSSLSRSLTPESFRDDAGTVGSASWDPGILVISIARKLER